MHDRKLNFTSKASLAYLFEVEIAAIEFTWFSWRLFILYDTNALKHSIISNPPTNLSSPSWLHL